MNKKSIAAEMSSEKTVIDIIFSQKERDCLNTFDTLVKESPVAIQWVIDVLQQIDDKKAVNEQGNSKTKSLMRMLMNNPDYFKNLRQTLLIAMDDPKNQEHYQFLISILSEVCAESSTKIDFANEKSIVSLQPIAEGLRQQLATVTRNDLDYEDMLSGTQQRYRELCRQTRPEIKTETTVKRRNSREKKEVAVVAPLDLTTPFKLNQAVIKELIKQGVCPIETIHQDEKLIVKNMDGKQVLFSNSASRIIPTIDVNVIGTVQARKMVLEEFKYSKLFKSRIITMTTSTVIGVTVGRILLSGFSIERVLVGLLTMCIIFPCIFGLYYAGDERNNRLFLKNAINNALTELNAGREIQ